MASEEKIKKSVYPNCLLCIEEIFKKHYLAQGTVSTQTLAQNLPPCPHKKLKSPFQKSRRGRAKGEIYRHVGEPSPGANVAMNLGLQNGGREPLGIRFFGQSIFDLAEDNIGHIFNVVSNFCNPFFRSPGKRIWCLIAEHQMKNEKWVGSDRALYALKKERGDRHGV